ncbi:MAG: hypothetical protein QOE45_1227 [Frankiaceae bacterium]|jgi:hypothetical protein|nr:hypothetical protein [Frankiaceae bacterium]
MTAMTYDTPRAPHPSVRLTRRGRTLIVLTLVALVLLAFSLGRTSAGATGSGTPVARPTTVVAPGETLWAIARRVAPGTDPRATVARLTQLNDLGSTPIVAGQRLVLPR